MRGPRTPLTATTQPHMAMTPAAQSAAQSAAPAAPAVAPSLLQQPAREAKIVFAGDTLAIHADNSSLAIILRQFASKSGMKIEGLGGDERVFGSFGPGAPRDVLADLMHGTNYNLVLVGDLANGSPRELILTPTTHGGGEAASGQASGQQVNQQNQPGMQSGVQPGMQSGGQDDAASEPVATQTDEPQGPLDLPTPVEDPLPPPAAEPTPGVKSPQQLFEQLQSMRQSQQQNPTPDASQEPPSQ